MDKLDTEGMYITDLSGKRLSKEDVEKLIEYNKNKPKSKFVRNPYRYYIDGNTLIKLNSDNFQAFILGENTKWKYSNEYTETLNKNINAYPRKYNVIENFEYESESLNDSSRQL